MRVRRKIGEYCAMVWDQDGQPPAHYVYGHVTEDAFCTAIERRFGGKVTVPTDAKIEHVYVRTVRSAPECDFRYEIRHCAKGRGASPRTVWTREPTRAEGA